jgi:hypothetical protein
VHCVTAQRFLQSKGDSLCHHCYGQMYQAKEDVDIERYESIGEIKKQVQDIHNALEERGITILGLRK